MGQLLTETKNGDVINTMTYDGYGNILTKNGNTYDYIDAAWDDLLTHYNHQAIAYDAQGNPTTYRGKSLVWEKGRQLKSYDGISYTYNANGIRTSKTVDGVKHTYILDGTKVLRETWGANTLVPLYDNEDSVCGISYNGTSYYFVKNLQGDIIAIADASNAVVARYSYDAWGVCTVVSDSTSVSIATVNPYRYRGYYYDVETGLYYLQSRYYDPEVGRFINGDETKTGVINGVTYNRNLYSYCDNNPVNQIDCSGFISMLVRLLIVVGAGIVVGLIDMNDVRKTKEFRKATSGGKFMQLATAFLYGFFKGAGAAFFTMLGGKARRAIISGLISFLILLCDNIKKLLSGKKMSKKNFTKAFSDGYTNKTLNQYLFGEIIEDFSKRNFGVIIKALFDFLVKNILKVFR